MKFQILKLKQGPACPVFISQLQVFAGQQTQNLRWQPHNQQEHLDTLAQLGNQVKFDRQGVLGNLVELHNWVVLGNQAAVYKEVGALMDREVDYYPLHLQLQALVQTQNL